MARSEARGVIYVLAEKVSSPSIAMGPTWLLTLLRRWSPALHAGLLPGSRLLHVLL